MVFIFREKVKGIDTLDTYFFFSIEFRFVRKYNGGEEGFCVRRKRNFSKFQSEYLFSLLPHN